MHILETSLENFRNISFASIRFARDKIFILGQNGQGKTNLLESMGLITALRSFRTADNRSCIHWKKSRAGLRFRVRMNASEIHEITLYFHNSGRKELHLDGEKVSRFSDFVGRFPVVICSSEDIQLLRGSPKNRRQFMDILFSATDPDYLSALRQYYKILKERNSLLKTEADDHQLHAFERLMASPAVSLIKKRKEGLDQVQTYFTEFYDKLSGWEERPVLKYRPDTDMEEESGYLEMLKNHRERDRILKTTSKGIHRDDFRFVLLDHRAKQFASEGQQRSLVIALRLAQLRIFEISTGFMPVLIIDDILGELDNERREAFWNIMLKIPQVFVSGTQIPDQCRKEEWQVLVVENGTFREEQASNL